MKNLKHTFTLACGVLFLFGLTTIAAAQPPVVLYDETFTGAELNDQVTLGNASYPSVDIAVVNGTRLDLSPPAGFGAQGPFVFRMPILPASVLTGLESLVVTVTIDWEQLSRDNDFGIAISDGTRAIGGMQGNQPINWSLDSPDNGLKLVGENFSPAAGLAYSPPQTYVISVADLVGNSTVQVTNNAGSSVIHSGLSPLDYSNAIDFLLVGCNNSELYGVKSVSILVEAQPTNQPVFLVIDEDSIGNGSAPNFFSDVEVNDDIADIGLRTQLPFFAANVGARITLHTGEVGDEGWFALKTMPDFWADAGPTNDWLCNFVLAGPGLGTEDENGDREALLGKIPDVTPLRASGLAMLEGQRVCAVVFDSDISINYDPLDGSLKGANLGVVAFKVISVTARTDGSDSSLPEVVIEILDADEACDCETLTRFLDAPEPISSSEPFDVDPP